jgi:hypothetical protein
MKDNEIPLLQMRQNNPQPTEQPTNHKNTMPTIHPSQSKYTPVPPHTPSSPLKYPWNVKSVSDVKARAPYFYYFSYFVFGSKPFSKKTWD